MGLLSGIGRKAQPETPGQRLLGGGTIRAALSRRQQTRGASKPAIRGDLAELRRMVGVDTAARNYLLFCVLPVWIGAGLFDWRRHRLTHIEETSGTHESILHALMMTEIGLPVLLALFFEVDSLVLLVIILMFFTHEATTYWDVAYADGLREVTPNEQHAHSFLEVLPFMNASVLFCLHWDQMLALFHIGKEQPDFRLRPKKQKLPLGYTVGVLAAVGAFIGLPYAEELWRCYRHDHTLASHRNASRKQAS